MDDFYAARSGTIPPLPWPNFAPPLIKNDDAVAVRMAQGREAPPALLVEPARHDYDIIPLFAADTIACLDSRVGFKAQ